MPKTKLLKNIDDIPKTLEYLSNKTKTPVEELEIKIQSFTTYLKKGDSGFFEILENDNLDLLENDDIFEEQENEFKQSYDIYISKIEKERNFSLRINNNFESLDLVLHKNFIPPQNENEFNDFISSINALKAAKGILLRKLKNEKEIITSNIKDIKNALKEEIIINLSRSEIFRDSQDSKLVFHVDGVDLSKKNIICAKKDTLICEFCFSKEGVSGKNLKGIYTKTDDKENNPPKLSNDFKEIDEEHCKKYFNIKSGFIIFEDNSFIFDENLSFQNLKARDNYNFVGSIDSNTNLTINTESEFEDALKEGASIIASKIIINGNVAANTTIHAKEIIITGQTHKDSTITTNKAQINVHKGVLNADMVKIQNLESGNVDCDDLEIAKANGGLLMVNNVNIQELHSNSTIQFSSKCIVNIMRGGGNKIIFTPLGSKKIREKIKNLEKALLDNETQQKVINLKAEALIYKYNKFHNTSRELKNIIEKNKEQNKETPAYILKNYNSFLEIVESIKSLKSQNLKIEKEQKQAMFELRESQKIVFDAEFICRDGWLKYNDVIFRLVIPKINTSKTIIKGIGRYYFEPEERRIIHQKIFKTDSDGEINNQGF